MSDSLFNGGLVRFTNEWIKNTGKDISFEDALKETSAIWLNLTPKEKGKYNEIPVVGPTAEQAYKSIMKNDISVHLRLTVNKNDIQCAKFFVVSFNYFIVTDPEKLHMPAEVSVCLYSMKAGLIRIYSKQLNPQADLFGSQYIALEHAQHTHKLPLPPKALGTTNLKQVYVDIIKFLQDYSDETSQNIKLLPPLYTKLEVLPTVKSCFKYMKKLAPQQPDIVVHSIEYLGDELKTWSRKLTKIDDSKLYESCEKEYEKDRFEYENELACTFHEREDRVKYCTQSQVIRWAYTLSQFLSKYFKITMKEISHCPVKYHETKPANDSFSSGGDSDHPVQNPKNTNSDYKDILKIINSGRSQNRLKNRQNSTKKPVSDVLLSHWNTKPPKGDLMGFGRGHS